MTAANESLNTEIKEIMCTVDKLRNNLYEDFKPHIKMIEELQISDEIKEVTPLVATKKVTRVCKVLPSSLQENQLEVLAIEPSSSKEIKLPNLPPTGALFKRPPVVDDIVYIMKSPVMPWIRAKVKFVKVFIITYHTKCIYFSPILIRETEKRSKKILIQKSFCRYKI